MTYTQEQIDAIDNISALADEQRLLGNIPEWKRLSSAKQQMVKSFYDDNKRAEYTKIQKDKNTAQRQSLEFLMNNDMKSIFDGVFRRDDLMGYIDLSQHVEIESGTTMLSLKDRGLFDTILFTEFSDFNIGMYRWNEIMSPPFIGVRRYKVMRNGELILFDSNDDTSD